MGLPATAEAAITAALTNNWKEAIRINTSLIDRDPNDSAALNRLAYAYTQQGLHTRAKATYEKVLKLDPYNQIAIKHSKTLVSGRQKKKAVPVGNTNHVSPLWFLEEPGKTKVVTAVNPAPLSTIAHLTPGMEVVLKPRKHCIEIRGSSDNVYLAALPDDISFRLLRLMASGNRYQALVKGLDKKTVIVILREVFRGKKFAGQPSFTAASIPMAQGAHPAIGRDEAKPGASLMDADGEGEENDQSEADEPNEDDHIAHE